MKLEYDHDDKQNKKEMKTFFFGGKSVSCWRVRSPDHQSCQWRPCCWVSKRRATQRRAEAKSRQHDRWRHLKRHLKNSWIRLKRWTLPLISGSFFRLALRAKGGAVRTQGRFNVTWLVKTVKRNPVRSPHRIYMKSLKAVGWNSLLSIESVRRPRARRLGPAATALAHRTTVPGSPIGRPALSLSSKLNIKANSRQFTCPSRLVDIKFGTFSLSAFVYLFIAILLVTTVLWHMQ